MPKTLDCPDLAPADYGYKAAIGITFNRKVDQNSVVAQQTVIIDLKNTSTGETATNIAGSFRFCGDSKIIVFISDENLGDLISIGAGQNYQYTVTVLGSGPTHVEDTSGEALDGDKDGVPGGSYIKSIEIVG